MTGEDPLYQDASAAIEARVEDLLDRMTVDEKVGQLVGGWAGQFTQYLDIDDAADLITEDGIGAASPFGWSGSVAHAVDDVVDAANTLQETAVEETRLGIPILTPVDAVHGHAYVSEATVFPNGLGIGATWDPDLAEAAADVTATEMRATGATQNYAPTIDIARDPRWGRTFETLGESPYLTKEFVHRQVEGYEGGDKTEDAVHATAKHFPAYGEPERGEDTSVVSLSEYEIRRMILPPAEEAIEAGVSSVMPSYNSINGEPVHGSEYYVGEMLREQFDFEGHVVSDWGGIDHLWDWHKTAEDVTDAHKQTRDAGLDIASVGGPRHLEALHELVDAGEIGEDRLYESVRRVLRAKFELGLFEDPYVDAEDATEVVGSEEHRELAREGARKSMTLLKNDDLLPLDRDADVFVTGPNADDLVRQRGGWTAYEGDIGGTTVREGIAAASEGTVTYEPGTETDEEIDIDAAVEAARDADVAVVALGEYWYIHEFVSETEDTGNGNFPTRLDLHLSEVQRDLVQAIHETGTPTVGLIVSGRAHIVDWMADNVPAILMAYFPGTEGGHAVADVLYGDADPGGRLPISIPRDEGQLPTYFNYFAHPRPIGQATHPQSYDPLYAFGHGLSYTDFEYTDVSLAEETIAPGETATVQVTVENVGDRAGNEVVQLYMEDLVSSKVTPERELRGFDRVSLDAGEATTVALDLTPDDLAIIEPDGQKHVEPGTFELTVGDETLELDVEA